MANDPEDISCTCTPEKMAGPLLYSHQEKV